MRFFSIIRKFHLFYNLNIFHLILTFKCCQDAKKSLKFQILSGSEKMFEANRPLI